MFKPLFARVLIKRDQLTSTKLIVREDISQRNAPAWGILMAAGPTVSEDIKELVGKRVYFGMHAGGWIKDKDGEQYYICQDEDLLCEE